MTSVVARRGVTEAVADPWSPPARSGGDDRREDLRLAAGDGRYLDDLGHQALAAAFVRSPHAHARIVDVDISRRPGAWTVWWPSTHTRTWRGRMAEAVARC